MADSREKIGSGVLGFIMILMGLYMVPTQNDPAGFWLAIRIAIIGGGTVAIGIPIVTTIRDFND